MKKIFTSTSGAPLNHNPNGTNGLQGKTILLVNTGSLKKRFILQRLKKLGLTMVVLNKEKNWAQPYVDHWILADNTNYTESLQAVREFIKSNPSIRLEGALTFWEDDVLLTSKIADKFGLIGIPYGVAKRARNKFLFREFCEENGIAAPKHILLKSPEDFSHILESFTFPIVVKPVYGSSSAYVVKVNNEEELKNTYDYIRKNISADVESALTSGLDTLAEEYIDGDEVDIDILLQSGKIKFFSITDNFKTREPFFVETGDSIPSSLPPNDQKALLELAEEVLEKLGVQNGCIHFEAKSTRNGPVPIEVNLRMGGDYVYSFVKSAWGVDLIESAVKIACGIYLKNIPKPEAPVKYLTGQYFLPEDSGILAKLDVAENLRKEPYLEEIHLFKEVGDSVLVPPEGYEFLGWATVAGDNPIDAQDNMRAAVRRVTYEVAKFNRESLIGKTSRKNRFSFAALNKDILLRAAKLEHIKRTTVENLRTLDVGIACNLYEESQDAIAQERIATLRNIQRALQEKGYVIKIFDFNNFGGVFEELRANDINLVLNLGAKVINSNLEEANATAVFDMLEVPHTGSDSFVLALLTDKIRMKKMLAYHNIPIPRWDYAYTLDDEIRDDLRYPLIVKPANSSNGMGIVNQSVATNKEELITQLKKIISEMEKPAIVEEFIEGDEYHVAILGNEDSGNLRALPLSRSIFKDLREELWPMYSSEVKQGKEELSQNIIVQRPPVNIPKKLESLITEIALDAYNFLDCTDYGMVKVRVDKDYNPYVICVDAMPGINIDDCTPTVANLVGLSYGDFLEELLRIAIMRYKKEPGHFKPLGA